MSFIKSISIEAVGLGLHLAAGAHEILLQTEDFLTSIPMSVPLSEIKRKKANVRSNQPENAQEGIQQVHNSHVPCYQVILMGIFMRFQKLLFSL